jgi:hypothetical protein
MTEQVTIRFHGENAEELKEAFWWWWSDRGFRASLSAHYPLRTDKNVTIETDGNVIHVRESERQ